VNYNTATPDSTFNLEIFRWEIAPSGVKTKVEREELLNLSMDPASPSYAPAALTQKSKLVDGFAIVPTAGSPGHSLSTGPLEAATAPDFAAAVNAVLAVGRTFRLSVGGKKQITVTVPDLVTPGPATFALARTALETSIQNAIQAQLAADLVTGLPVPAVKVDVLRGPAAVAASPAETTLIRITATTASPANEIRVTSATTSDLAKLIGFGPANGGLEVGAFAKLRPAPTGVTFASSRGLDGATVDTAPAIQLGTLLKNDLLGVTLDEVTSSGAVAARSVPLALGAATRTWTGGVGGKAGVLTTLAAIRDQVNAYQAANPTTFFWRAELWGYRLSFLDTTGGDNGVVGPAGTSFTFTGPALPALNTIGADMAARFLANVRYLSVGPGGDTTLGSQAAGLDGKDGGPPAMGDYTAAYELVRSDVDLWNLLVLPPDADQATAVPLEQLWGEASAFARDERAFLIMDPPPTWVDTQTAASGANTLRLGLTKDHSAVYFPRLKLIENGREYTVGPAGAMAGLYARIDSNRGVWKAPAGTEADLRGVAGVDYQMSDLQNGAINPAGVNAIRLFPEGVISWGARTMDGADAFASEYKYVPIRRLALMIEESLYRGLKWVVFEPNDEPLWSQIRLNVGSFMHDLFRKGAFAGAKPTDAYFVRCDRETTNANDQNLGIVNIWVGFAPLKPAEFVVLYLQQIAQKLAT